jgi:hypothetical protein
MVDPGEILAERNREVAKIQGFADLTPEAKERRIAAVNEKANAEYSEAQERQKQERESRLKNSERAAIFSVVDDATATSAERAAIFSSYRSAAADVSLAASPEELEGLLTQAERTGDVLLARAAFHAAIDRGHQPLVERYLSTRPKEAKAWERYTSAVEEAQQATGIEGLLGTALFERALNGQ